MTEAVELLERLLDTLGDQQLIKRIQCLNQLSYTLFRLGKLTTAEERAQEALTLADQSPPDISGQGDALNNLGCIYYELGNIDQSIEYFKKSLARREQIGEPRSISATLQNLGVMYQIYGNLERAEKYLLRGVEIFEKHVDSKGETSMFQNLSLFYWFRGDLELAEAFGQRAFTLAEQSDNPFHTAWSLLCLGVVSWYKGDLKSANDLLERSFTLFKHINYPYGILVTIWGLTSVLLDLNAIKKAENYMATLSHLAHEVETPFANIVFQVLTAMVKLKQHELTSTLELASQARAQAKKLNIVFLEVQALQIQLQASLQQYSLTHHLELKIQSEQLLHEMAELGNRERLYKVQVEVNMMSGMLKRVEAKFSDALDQFEQAHKLAETYGFQDQAQKSQDEITQLKHRMVMFQKLQEISPQASEQAQLADMLNYLQKAQKHIQQEQFKSRL